ncbi:universal stress protein PHOS34-like isoform X1 [Prosopis cineraria]|uniref:universal stress protein PHOS34-like isoform X1 n=1 Tax=Prosopis cineraria TaxID=364024 RepID=UPI00240F3C07|nr:universal stress protein PHOS34-like isoform X1 [Prosopis cineraria]
MATSEKQVMVVGIDEYDHSTYALQWTLDHLFANGPNPSFKLVLVHAKPTAASAVGIAGPGAADALPVVDSDLRKIAARVVEKAKEICTNKSVNDAAVEVVEGDPRNVLCDAVERHHASMLVVGSHGYGTIKRAVLGSVSDYCAHHAHCTVMIVKKPKIKH